jgi:hypothetical protein
MLVVSSQNHQVKPYLFIGNPSETCKCMLSFLPRMPDKIHLCGFRRIQANQIYETDDHILQ